MKNIINIIFFKNEKELVKIPVDLKSFFKKEKIPDLINEALNDKSKNLIYLKSKNKKEYKKIKSLILYVNEIGWDKIILNENDFFVEYSNSEIHEIEKINYIKKSVEKYVEIQRGGVSNFLYNERKEKYNKAKELSFNLFPENYDKCIIPMVRRIAPKIIAAEITGVKPAEQSKNGLFKLKPTVDNFSYDEKDIIFYKENNNERKK